jgi:hypothetical protein
LTYLYYCTMNSEPQESRMDQGLVIEIIMENHPPDWSPWQ